MTEEPVATGPRWYDQVDKSDVGAEGRVAQRGYHERGSQHMSALTLDSILKKLLFSRMDFYAERCTVVTWVLGARIFWLKPCASASE